MVFYSKHDIWLGLLIFGPTSYAILETYLDTQLSLITILLLMILLLLLWIWIGTYYRIEGDTLMVRCGPSVGRYTISEIRSVRDSRSWLSSPACSLDRLEVRGETFNLLLSPKHKTEFISALQEVNQSIEYIKS